MVDIPLRVKGTFDDREINKGLSGLKKQVKGIKDTFGGIFVGLLSIQGLRILTQTTGEVIKLAGAMGALDISTAKVDTSSRQLIRTLQDATRGQVSINDLVISANSAVALLGEKSIPRLGELAEVAAKASTALGTDLTKAFSDIVTGIGRQSKLILDNLGIIIDTTKAYEDYAESIGKVAKELTDAEKKQAFLNATIEQGIEKFGDVEAISDPIKQIGAAFEDLGKIIIGKLFGVDQKEALSSLAESIRDLNDTLQEVDPKVFQDIAKSLVIIAAAVPAVRVLGGIGVALGTIKTLIPKITASFEAFLLRTPGAFMAFDAGLSTSAVALEQLSFRIAQFKSVIGPLSVGMVLLGGLAVTWRENWDNLKATWDDSLEVLDSLFGAIKDLGIELGIYIEWSEVLEGVVAVLTGAFKALSTGLHFVGLTFTTITGQWRIAIAVLADLAEWIETGTTDWNNFNTALDGVITNLTTIVNRIRELAGFGPLQDIVSAALPDVPQVDFDAIRASEAARIANIRSVVAAITAAGIPTPEPPGPGGGVAEPTRLELALEKLPGKEELFAARVEFELFKETMEEVERQTRKTVQAFLDLIDSQKLTAEAQLMGKIGLGAQAQKLRDEARIQAEKDKNRRFQEFEERRLAEMDAIAKDFLKGMSKIFEKFAKQIGDISDLFGDFGPFADQLLGLGGKAFGASLFGKGGFSQGGAFAKGGALGGLGPDIMSSAIIAAGGFVLNRLFGGDKPIEIKQPIDMRLVDIETRFLNFFNFRGAEGVTFRSDFREVFESGMF